MKHHVPAALAGVVLLVVCLLAEAPEAECATVQLGGDAGWTNTANINYNTWLSNYNIKVGDSLSFYNPDTTDHSVVQVDKLGYDTCGASGEQLDTPFTISQDIIYTVSLPESMQMYFICEVPGHCSQGMKVNVPVYNADGTMTLPAGPASSSAVVAMPRSNWTSQLLLLVVVAAVSVATAIV